MKISTQNKPRGIALFIVMIAIFVLSVMAAIFAASMKVEIKLAQHADHEEQLLWLGISGVNYCKAVLAQENCPYDSLNQLWAGGSGSVCDTNLEVQNPVKVGDGSFSWKIVDLERYININKASPAELRQALSLIGVGADNISTIADSIVDWIDANNSPGLAGAESDYYQTLNPPYYAKNAPIDNLSELLLIKGIRDHPGIYSPLPQRSGAFRHKLGFGNSPFQSLDNDIGLSNIFTAVSTGRVNIYTADTNVLDVLFHGDDNAVQNFVQARNGPDGVPGTEDDAQVPVPPALAKVATARSSTFKVDIMAHIGNDPPRHFVAILYRNSPTDIKVLSFYWN